MRSIRVLCLVSVFSSACLAQELSRDNYDQLVPQGKEADAIYGGLCISQRVIESCRRRAHEAIAMQT